ncbi:helicase-related protein [Oribacterium sp. WCC10]|uniref:helicase-related protein n=1 Tax=Oribacterium sp. WCC10 TaxID=1855343 RepID=UPI0008E6F2F6|nr:helicase-related protein [Oribacterium sp. WCC10]SFG84186.1 Type III restriction enzyme, res subunit [Oribacterium sp. WCC10]
MGHTDLYIVDNGNDEQTVKKYLREWCPISKQMDITTGYLEIGGLLSLDTEWQKLDKVRIILGNEVTRRTKDVIDKAVEALLTKIKDSIDEEQEKNDFLIGVPAILDALKSGKIECRVYDKSKFHAKAYITYFRDEYKAQFPSSMNVPDGYALVGSSNFTKAGLTQNIELNVQIRDDVDQLQSWFEKQWDDAEDITTAILEVIEMHCKEYSPYDVYLRSMYEYFKGREESVSEWENHDSVIYPGLSQYQRDGYNSLVQIAEKYSGAFLCDGVGLGKTFVGMMLIERFVKKERKNVVLIVPASARISVWETTIKKYMPEILEGFYPFKIINHTDLLLEKNQNLMDQIAEHAEIVVIDEAHHFRNQASNRYRKLFSMMGRGKKKQMFMLTATPINNSFRDLQHLIELFTQKEDGYFAEAPLGIHSLSGHFIKMEKKLNSMTGTDVTDSIDITDDIFRGDQLVNELVVQRSRAYVKKSLVGVDGAKVLFSERKPPVVANYSIEKSYGSLIDDFVKSFNRKDSKTGKNIAILALAVYSPYEEAYFKGDRSKIDDMVFGRQAQVVNLIRQLLLKRFESSIAAFEETCIRIYVRLRKFMVDYKQYGNVRAIDRLFKRLDHVQEYVEWFINNNSEMTLDDLEDDLPDYVWNTEEKFDVNDFDLDIMLDDTIQDLEILSKFIEDMMDIKPENDDKIRELKRILLEDKHAKDKKIIIFSEFRATALYLYRELQKAGFKNIYEIDGKSSGDRHEMVQRFAPYYNDLSSSEIEDEIQILIATDVLAEGLNLQDAQCLINYELHWNPVRLMQRIGRVDRRRNADIEEKLLRDHPELKDDRPYAYYWNFLPPAELEQLLSLYKTVSKKTLRISKTFGIEGQKLLTPDDEYEALKDFNSQYEGSTSADEEIALDYQKLIEENPGYEDAVLDMPKKMFSGKKASTRKGIFFCYELPTKRADGTWSHGDGWYRWYYLDPENGNITDDTYEIWKAIRCNKDEARVLTICEETFTDSKKKMDSYIKKNYLRAVQAPLGEKPRLVTWMELA